MKGVWVWPESQDEQEQMLKRIRSSEYLITILSAISKSKDGLSNAQVDLTVKSYSQWNTRWAINELEGLGLIDYKVDLFGGAGKYTLTDLGRNVFQNISDQQPKEPAQH